MYVNKIPFLIMISRNIKLATIELLGNQQEETIGKCITNVMHLYGSQGFLVNMTHANGEFEMLHGRLLSDAGSGLNVCSNAEHVPEIECFIRNVKERAWCMYNSVPFSRFLILLIKEMVTACVIWLNMFLPNNGISTTLSPRALMTGFTFGSYVQTHEDHNNSMQSRTMGAIAL
jgi:hypothetical protein